MKPSVAPTVSDFPKVDETELVIWSKVGHGKNV